MPDKKREKTTRKRRSSLQDLEDTMRIGRVPVQQVGDLVGLSISAMSRRLSGEVEMITEEIEMTGEALNAIRAANEAVEEAREKALDESRALRKTRELE